MSILINLNKLNLLELENILSAVKSIFEIDSLPLVWVKYFIVQTINLENNIYTRLFRERRILFMTKLSSIFLATIIEISVYIVVSKLFPEKVSDLNPQNKQKLTTHNISEGFIFFW